MPQGNNSVGQIYIYIISPKLIIYYFEIFTYTQGIKYLDF
jgi:hypothetical protein